MCCSAGWNENEKVEMKRSLWWECKLTLAIVNYSNKDYKWLFHFIKETAFGQSLPNVHSVITNQFYSEFNMALCDWKHLFTLPESLKTFEIINWNRMDMFKNQFPLITPKNPFSILAFSRPHTKNFKKTLCSHTKVESEASCRVIIWAHYLQDCDLIPFKIILHYGPAGHLERCWTQSSQKLQPNYFHDYIPTLEVCLWWWNCLKSCLVHWHY